MLARDLDGLGEHQLAAVDLDVVLRFEGVSDVFVADRAVDATVSGAYLDLDGGLGQYLAKALGIGLALRQLAGALGEAGLKLCRVGLGGRQGQTLWDQPVAGVTVLDGHYHSGFSERVDRLEQDDVHFRTSFSVIGMMARTRARLMVNASLRWYLAFTPVRRRGNILPVSLMKRRSMRPSW